jgi:hypothetical protein
MDLLRKHGRGGNGVERTGINVSLDPNMRDRSQLKTVPPGTAAKSACNALMMAGMPCALIHARAAGVPAVATNDVLYHAPGRHMLQDVLTCIREGCTIDQLGYREASCMRHLQAPEEMARLFARYPDAIARTQEIAERCRFSPGRVAVPVSA